jgi:hypothetical protein
VILGGRNAVPGRIRNYSLQSERFELPGPLGGGIAKSFDANTAGQASLDGGFDQTRRKKGERDGHVDLPDAALFASGDLFSLGD